MKPEEPDLEPVELVTDRYDGSFIAGEIFVHLISILRNAVDIVKLTTIRLLGRR